MKKTYTKPEADKIAFKYRDQVVAASGDGTGSGSGTGSSMEGATITAFCSAIDILFDYAGTSIFGQCTNA